ncbi:TauD/TfdA dioxygenase family protein [Streptomyces sp. NPDC059340]|uniref:TauD/TfdA dioxygenase family protein n=1 Tax=Streptomyces sp. NPDC059340 TaxID=3346806 RepID=UPI003694B71E
MIATKALSPSLGVEVTGVGNLLDDQLISRCAEALQWRGILLIRGLHLDDEGQLAFSRKLGKVFAVRGKEISLRVVHSFEAAQRLVTPDPGPEVLAGWREVPTHETPLVWKRRDGRRSLVIGATADHIVGMAAAESRALLDRLLEWTTQERFRYTHDWRVGDLVVWDNTGMLHRALPYSADSERTLQRTTVVGDEELS